MSLYQGDGTSLMPNVEVCWGTTTFRACVCLGVYNVAAILGPEMFDTMYTVPWLFSVVARHYF